MMMTGPSDLEIRRIVTDSDLDGVVTAAILRRWWTDAEVIFGHPGELRAGLFDEVIDEWTAVCDLPMHPRCGLSIDHHQSNRPGNYEGGAMVVWRDSPSAARIAYDLFSEIVDLADLEGLLFWVDKLDSGSITRDEFLSDAPAIWLSRIIDSGEGTAAWVLEQLRLGRTIEGILSDSRVSELISEKERELEFLNESIRTNMRVEDRMAVVRLDGSGTRSNGYHVTAMAGDECDACMIVHGDLGASFGDSERYPVSASFYTNSFLHPNGGVFDLTALATRFDSDGGGHANACGCRIKPTEGGEVVERMVSEDDIERNILVWLKMWSQR
tara:strand:+ start:12410 stop:13390 length:981 start_codon:yes stop_codon:yes gene_type:complete